MATIASVKSRAISLLLLGREDVLDNPGVDKGHWILLGAGDDASSPASPGPRGIEEGEGIATEQGAEPPGDIRRWR
jgi:hypothetical protein